MRAIVLTLLAACLTTGIAGAQAQDCGKICVLSGFEPNPDVNPGQANSTPICSSEATPAQKNAIQAAFDIAPVNVRTSCASCPIFLSLRIMIVGEGGKTPPITAELSQPRLR